MNKDQERYQKSFQKLHLSEDFRERLDARLEKEREDKKMKKTTFLGLTRAAAEGSAMLRMWAVSVRRSRSGDTAKRARWK